MIEYSFFSKDGTLNLAIDKQGAVFSGWGDSIYCYSFQNPQKLIAKFRLKSKTK